MTDQDQRHTFAAWVEGRDVRHTPSVDWVPWRAPRYARKTLTERIEPYATEYERLAWEHPYLKDAECSAPDPEWYTPTPKLLELEERLDALSAKAFREVPNPDYDAARAAAYWANRRDHPTTIEMGQSDTPVF